MISLLVVDDHVLIRRGLSDLFADVADIEIVAMAANGADAVAAARDSQADVVLMDLSMPGMDGVAATRELLAASPHSRVVILTSFTESDRVTDAVNAGATGYLLKDAEPHALIAGVRAAARGEAPFDTRAAGALLPERSAGTGRLTNREREILGLVGQGLPNKTIARRLGISEKTVKTHLTNAFAAIGVTDRTSAAIWVQRHGLSA